MIAWLYARTSTAKNTCRSCDRKFLSADDQPVCPQCSGKDIIKSQDAQNQLRILRAWMASQGHNVTAEYIDRASAKSGDREQFIRMFEDLESRGKAPVVIAFWALDRLSREGVFETLQYLRKITALGGEWKSYTEQFLDSTGPFRDAIIAIFATLAKQQRIRISENARAGLERAKISGTKSGRPIGRPHEIDLKEAQRIYDETKSYRATGRALGVSGNAVQWALQGRPEPKPLPIVWSSPIWGVIEAGEFIERRGGPVVVRYDNNSGTAYCINHSKPVALCADQHVDAPQLEDTRK